MTMQEVDRSTLGWVRKEIDETLKQAVEALQEYSEEREDRTRLRFCATYLHQVYGTLQMLELYGASLLAEELEQLIEALIGDGVEKEFEAEEALMTGILRLSEFLERIEGGQPDSPLGVLSQVNDLRMLRGEKLLTESMLLPADAEAAREQRRERSAGADLAAVAGAQRAGYQRGLLAVLRGDVRGAGSNKLIRALDALDAASSSDATGDIWWSAAGVVEGLQQEALPLNAAVKGLLGQVEQQIRRVAGGGEQLLLDDPPSDLFKNLLYYVVQAGPATERLKAIHERFRLDDLAADASRAGEAGYSPGADVLESVSRAIREDITQVKDGLDLFVRGKQKDTHRVIDAGAILRRISDTLGMLGLGGPRTVVREQIELVDSLADGAVADDKQLLDLARALLYVESSLDALVQGERSAGDDEAIDDGELLRLEYRGVYLTAIREAVADIGTLKDAIVHFMERDDHGALDQVETLTHRLRGALDMVGLDRVGEMVAAIADFIRHRILDPQVVPEASTMDVLADAITSLEYYLEAVLERRSGRDAILDVAERSIARLNSLADDAHELQGPSDEPGDGFMTLDAGGLSGLESDAGDAMPDNDSLSDAGVSASPPPVPAGVTAGINFDIDVKADAIDEEILEIFLEEVDEVMETLRESYPRWRANQEDGESLTTVRRMFHTLKGSGRMAGALLLGELGWSVERLLNRVIDRHVEAGSQVFDIVDTTLEAIPELVAELQHGTVPKTDVRALMRAADQLADPSRPQPDDPAEEDADATAAGSDEDVLGDPEFGDRQAPPTVREPEPADAGETEPQLAAEAPEPEQAAEPEMEADESEAAARQPGATEIDASGGGEAGPDAGDDAEADEARAPKPAMDPTLYEIFSNEASDHLSVVRDFIGRHRAKRERGGVTEELARALHTLTGSARMADIMPVATLGRRLESFVYLRRDQGRALDADDVTLLEQGVDRIHALVEALGDDRLQLPEIDDVIAGVDARSKGAGGAERLVSVDVAAFGSAMMEDDDEDIDSDLVELFLEEAEDILQFLEGSVANWEADGDRDTRISELQRSLHTLKGGARLARQDRIGDLCHALESLTSEVEAGRVGADERFLEVLQVVLERLADMVAQVGRGEPVAAADDLLATLADMGAGEGVRRLAGSGPAVDAEAGTEAEAEAEEEAERDNELVEVFLEEAAEILQTMEAALHAWRQDPSDDDQLTALQRALHTLKGGARMAGFRETGNLGHEAETLLNAVRDGSVPADATLFDLLDATHDRLYLMRDNAEAEVPEGTISDLLERIEALRTGLPGDSDDDAETTIPAATGLSADEAGTGARPAAPDAAEAAPAAEAARTLSDQVRVRAEVLDDLVNFAGEVSIYRARLEQQIGSFRFNLGELDQTVNRLREQLRTLEIETEAQILYRYEREHEQTERDREFDPLELDRFSRMQELSRGLSESVSDLSSIEGMLETLARESETLLLQQARVNTELQDGLMRTRMVPFANLAPRLRRIVRQTAQELGRKAQIRIEGAQGEMDRTVLERVTAPLEHMLRNAVVHGIEPPEERLASGKRETGLITISLDREGADLVLRVSDDGAGLDLNAIRRKALDRGLVRQDVRLSDHEIMQFVLEQGFSTAREVTQIAGRGVGMDVVNAEIKQLGGTLEIDSSAGQGTRFTVRMPFTLAMNQALLCVAADQVYAIPLPSIDGVVRMSEEELGAYLALGGKGRYHYRDRDYQVLSLLDLLATGEPNIVGRGQRIPVVLVHTGDHRLALHVDELIGSREIVVKSVGPQISSVPGIFGATILADGRVVLILDINALLRHGPVQESDREPAPDVEPDQQLAVDVQPTVMVVDDSITMRKVATRLLERNNMTVVTAKDGVDAVARLQEQVPDAMLLDIEMPRMDGYELATHMRNDERLKDVPIIMITSRTGEKHRQRAMDIGVDRYIGKPYQETDLLENLQQVLEGTDVRA